MPNATARVARAYRSVRDENWSHSWGTLAAPAQLYNAAMVGLTAAGYMTKFDDAAALRFLGIITDDPHASGGQGPKVPSDGGAAATQGAASLFVAYKQPQAFELSVVGVGVGDIGRRVYATFDNAGTLDVTATTFGNCVGVVKDVVYAADGGVAVADLALVAPIYDVPSGRPATVYAASGVVAIREGLAIITKAGVAALTLADPTAGVHDGLVMRFQSTTAQAHTLDNSAGSGFNAGGAATDVGTWGGAKGDGMEITAYGGKWLVNYLRNVTLG